MSLGLNLRDIADVKVRDNFKRIEDASVSKNPVEGFALVTLDTDVAVTDKKIAHGLRYVPRDILVTRSDGAGVVTINYDDTDSEYLVVSATGAVDWRAFTGTFSPGGT